MILADVTEDLLDFKLAGPLSAHQVLLIICGLLMIVMFTWAARNVPAKPKKAGFHALLEYGLVWVRDEVVYPWLGPERGRRYLPFHWTLFFFVLFSNLFGLIPFPFYPEGHTDALVLATANLAVTGGLAIIVFVVYIAAGMREHGAFKYWGTLVPHGIPMYIVPVVFFVEFIGLITRAVALTVRLFANMLSGHALLAILFGFLIGIEHYSHPVIGMPQTIINAATLVLVMLFETLIALIQAYIFTVLSAIFISISVAEAH
jgi:F-type H+-transporting ATPase subunit a